MEKEEISIEPLKSVEDFRVCQEIQRRAWGLAEESYVIPIATMAGVSHYGGLILGARRGQDLVGFSFAFLGRFQTEIILYSQLTAVLPGEQGGGTGYKLKLSQREWALAHGLASILWAFDPLQLGNANFNLHRLGACARHYEPDMYGQRSDALNKGLPFTDRLIAEWDLSGKIKSPEIKLEECKPVINTSLLNGKDPRVANTLEIPASKEGPLCLEIPGNLKFLAREAPEEAGRWQASARTAFQKLFTLGYAAVDFARKEAEGETRGWYILA